MLKPTGSWLAGLGGFLLGLGLPSGPAQAQELRIWGDNASSQISGAPDGEFKAATGGALHSLALRFDGTPVLWGAGPFGPPPIPATLAAERFHSIAIGRDDAVLIQLDGTLAAFGRNAPVVAVPAGFYKAVSVSATAAVAIGEDGSLTAWGRDRYPPVIGPITGLLNAPRGGPYKQVDSILLYSLALHEDGTVYGWGSVGSNSTNVLAGWAQTPEDPSVRYIPGETFKAIAAGNVHALAIRPDGSFTGWGNGSGGALDVPTHVKFKAIDAGWGYSIASRPTGPSGVGELRPSHRLQRKHGPLHRRAGSVTEIPGITLFRTSASSRFRPVLFTSWQSRLGAVQNVKRCAAALGGFPKY